MRAACIAPNIRPAIVILVMLALGLGGCAQGPAPSTTANSQSTAVQEADTGPLVIYLGNEPTSLATRAFAAKGRGLYTAWRMFNATLAVLDARGQPQPELLTSLPSLNTDSWQVSPDGTM